MVLESSTHEKVILNVKAFTVGWVDSLSRVSRREFDELQDWVLRNHAEGSKVQSGQLRPIRMLAPTALPENRSLQLKEFLRFKSLSFPDLFNYSSPQYVQHLSVPA